MWEPCTNCDGEGGWFEDSDTWTPCPECDGVGGWDITDNEEKQECKDSNLKVH